MARYSTITKLSGSAEEVNDSIRTLLHRCRLNVLHNTQDYWVAGEPPGEKPFSQLVTVELFLDRKMEYGGGVQVTCIAKNEELPLQSINHCQQLFYQLKSELSQLQSPTHLAASQPEPLR